METPILSRKYKIEFISILFLLLNFTLKLNAQTDTGKIPVLHHLGVIPTQWQSAKQQNYYETKLQKDLEISFPNAVRNTKRFDVLNDDLVKSFWKSPAGREELKNDYELSAYASLTVVPTSDTYVLVSRLLSPDFEVLLQESKTLPIPELLHKNYEEVHKSIQDLVYKLFNRLPIDASITSIQGRYISISGGISQGINVGDNLTIIRSRVKSRHPANRSWLEFETIQLGKATVVDVKKQTTVAQITELTKEDAVEIGDGVKIQKIAGRTNFARQSESSATNRLAQNETIIVPPLYSGDKKISSKPFAKDSDTLLIAKKEDRLAYDNSNSEATDLPAPVEEAASEENTEQPILDEKVEEAPQSAVIQPSEDESSNLQFPIGLDDVKGAVSYLADEITFKFGQKWWWYKGPGATGSVLTWYLPINEVGVTIKRKVMDKIKYDIGGNIGIGKTHGGGSFSSLEAHARIYMEGEIVQIPEIKKWKAGGHGGFSTIGVENSGYGGHDFLMGGIFAGVEGAIKVDTYNVDWYADFSLTPLTFGKIGYLKSKKSIRSSLGWELNLGGFLPTRPQTLEWGGGLYWGGHNVSDSESREVGVSTFGINGQLRYRF